LRDFANFRFVQARPAFFKCGKALSPVIAGARFNAQIVFDVPEMNRNRLAEGHLGRDFAVAIADTLAMFFEKFGSLACATLKCDVLSDFQTSLPPAKALA
jgi:hypothetical protein